MRWRASFIRSTGSGLAFVVLFLFSRAWAQNASTASPMSLSPAQIVEQMQRHSQEQSERLEHYHALRHYAVEYKGYFRKIKAEMDVEVIYDAASGKSFRIVSQSGSSVLCQKVLKRAVDSEQEAALNKDATALTEENYSFRLLGSGFLNDRPAYILYVEPLTESEFLYKGKIWVDAEDFALVKLEVEPARNPSFWISRTLIQHTYAQTGGFWLPEYNRSETKVRIGGEAVMTIDYGTYQIVSKQAEREARAQPGEDQEGAKPSMGTNPSFLPMVH